MIQSTKLNSTGNTGDQHNHHTSNKQSYNNLDG